MVSEQTRSTWATMMYPSGKDMDSDSNNHDLSHINNF